MIGIITILIIFLVSACAYTLKTRTLSEKDNFWRRLYAIVTLKAVNYIFNTSDAKIVITYVKSSTLIVSALMFGIPCITGNIFSADNKLDIFFKVEWGTVDTIVIILYLISNAIVIALHLHKNKGKQSLSSEDRALLVKSSNDGDDIKSDTREILNILRRSDAETLNKLFPLIIDDVKKLRLKSALEKLTTFKNEAINLCPNNYRLNASINLWIGNCNKFLHQKDCIDSYQSALNLAAKAGIENNPDYLECRIYLSCINNDKQIAGDAAKTLGELQPNNPWRYVADFYFTDNRQKLLDEIESNFNGIGYSVICQSFMLFHVQNRLHEIETLKFNVQELNDISYGNLTEWITNMFFAVQAFSKKALYRFDKEECSIPEAATLFSISDKFLSVVNHSEIIDNMPDVPLFHAISGYIYSSDFKWIIEIERLKVRPECLPNQIMAIAVGYTKKGDTEKALDILSKYDSWEPLNVRTLYLLLLLRNGYFDKIKDLMADFIDKDNQLPSSYLPLILDIVRYIPSLTTLACNIKLADQNHQQLFNEFVLAVGGEQCDKQFILSSEHDIPQDLNSYYPIVLYCINEKELAYQKLRGIISSNKLNELSFLYIKLLQELGHLSEQYNFIRELRINGQIDTRLLFKELRFTERLHRNNESLQITALLMAEFPRDPQVVYHRLLALHLSEEPILKLLELHNETKELNYDVITVKNISSILLLRGMFRESLDFLYYHTMRTGHQDLKDYYFCMHTNPYISEIIEEELQLVSLDNYVMYLEDNKVKWGVITQGSTFESFLGKTKGDIVNIRKGASEKTVTIQSIKSKYFKLLEDVVASVHANQSKVIWSMQVEDLGPDLFKGLTNVVEKYNGGKNKKAEALNEYKDNHRALYNFIGNHAPIHKAMSLIYGDFLIYQAPTAFVIKQTGLSKETILQNNIVLDLTSAVLLFGLSKELNINWKDKFIIPQSLLDVLKYEILQTQRKTIREILPPKIFELIPTEQVEGNSSILIAFKKWIEANCVFESDVRKLDLIDAFDSTGIDDDEVLDCIIESRLLATQKGRILISEDTYLNSQLCNGCLSIPSETLMLLLFPLRKKEISSFLSDCYFVGSNIDEAFIQAEYNKYTKQEVNRYNYCLNCLEQNPYNSLAFFKVAESISKRIYTPDNDRQIINILLDMLRCLGAQNSIATVSCLYPQIRSTYLKNCLRQAFQIYTSTHVVI
jgi:hypothetical protein